MAGQELSIFFGQEMYKRSEEMGLHEESATGSLHPIAAANSSYFLSKFLLLLPFTQMLNHGITYHDVKALVFERESTAVSQHRGEAGLVAS
jgi:hypothetical protein